jgi:hypothetical protein
MKWSLSVLILVKPALHSHQPARARITEINNQHAPYQTETETRKRKKTRTQQVWYQYWYTLRPSISKKAHIASKVPEVPDSHLAPSSATHNTRKQNKGHQAAQTTAPGAKTKGTGQRKTQHQGNKNGTGQCKTQHQGKQKRHQSVQDTAPGQTKNTEQRKPQHKGATEASQCLCRENQQPEQRHSNRTNPQKFKVLTYPNLASK